MKQLGDDPWVGISRRYPQGTRLFGKVTNLTDYGAFIEIEQGIEGLVHVSEMDWTNKNVHPSKVVSLGDEVEVMILEIDEDRRRISLGMKQCMPNPLGRVFAMNHKKGDKVAARSSRSPTSACSSVCPAANIDGLVHLSDLSWNAAGEEAVKNYKKGDEVRPWCWPSTSSASAFRWASSSWTPIRSPTSPRTNDKGSIVKGTVKAIDPKGAVIHADEVEGYLRAEISRERVEDIRSHLKEGDEIEAVIVNVDRKTRNINLSIKAKDNAEEKDAMKRMADDAPNNAGTTNLGALLKAKMKQGENN